MNSPLSEKEIEIYKKQINLEEINLEGQKKIKQTKVLVVGIGGLGCPILIYLVASGIGHIGIVDEDIIEESNLNRQVLYKVSDVKMRKTVAAKKNLDEIGKESKVIIHNYKLNNYNKLEVISNYDIVIDATDNFETRHIIDESCYKLHKICIYGAVNKFEGQVAVFNYKSGIRYNDLYKVESEIVENKCDNIGMMGITTGYIGILQAIETLKMIIGLNTKCKNYINRYYLIEIIKKQKYIRISRNKSDYIRTITNINKDKKYLSDQRKYTNKYNEIKINLESKQKLFNCHLEKSINIPISKIKLNQTIKLLKKYSIKKTIILYCNNKIKANIASNFLEQKRIKHKIIKTNNEIC
uniref:Molybdopterin biosynthesis protein n=1 Tax=Polysiphonia infestans TaxID=2006978 RepID=A0A1Z1MF44_9FLOR|nr:Molybdopterin biosynthesis protein [Polysiphonia infestans]ARW64445.1 Molybdopterin biosynthesis protein [Polysiphonia infestans]